MEKLTLHADKYALNMMYAHWREGSQDQQVAFEVLFRRLPFGNGFAVFAGLNRLVEYLEGLRFDEGDLAYLRQQEEGYDERFYDALRSWRFQGNLDAVREGELVFPNEPLLVVRARIFEALLIEAALLNFVNYQTLVATKAARIRHVAPADGLLEFGTRRAQEADAAIWGARAAYLAGFDGTSNVEAGRRFGIPTRGTHSHAWVQSHADELSAFRAFASAHPDHTILLVDTYDTLGSGVPNAIRVAHELEAAGHRLRGIRIDSGDLAHLSRAARRQLDEAGLSYVRIVASNDLDEDLIADLKLQEAAIDTWGVGTRLITGAGDPALGGVYKLVARQEAGEWQPVIKLSENPEKISTPGIKQVYRIFDPSGRAVGDYVALADEPPPRHTPLTLFDPVHTYRARHIPAYEAIPLLQPIFRQGRRVASLPDLDAARAYHVARRAHFDAEVLRRVNPHTYGVSLSDALWALKLRLIRERRPAP